MFNGTSPFVEGVDNTFLFIIVISLILLISLTFLMIYFIVRYRKDKHPEAAQIEGSTTLEIVWTVIPGILVILMFWFGWKSYVPMREVPADAMKVTSVARMWGFTFNYENGKSSPKLVVPVNKPVRVQLEAVDVLHAFYIPAFRVKNDMVPGNNDQWVWFTANKTGSYDLFCAEYCGTLHSAMITKVEVLTEEEFTAWYEGTELSGEQNAGLTVLQNNACIACHSLDGAPGVGPSFKGILGRETRVLVDGKEQTLVADEEYLIRSILKPDSEVVSGYPKGIMQSYEGRLSDQDLQNIVDYLKTLK